jgi:hypothetical protein
MKNVMICPFEPERAIIYQRKDAVTENYYVRLKKIGGGFITRSLKTKSQDFALERARKIYLELLMAEKHSIVYGKNTFKDLWPTFIKKSNASKERKARMMHLWDRYFRDFFGHMQVSTVDVKVWEDYIKWRVNYWNVKKEKGEKVPYNVKPTPTEKTLMSEHQCLRQFLFWCKETHRLYQVPRLRVVLKEIIPKESYRKKKTRGKAIPMPLMQSIEAKIRHHAQHAKDTNRIRTFARWRLYYYIKILYHSGARPIMSELGSIRWNSIIYREDKKHNKSLTAIMQIENGKNGPRTAVMTYAGTRFLLKWRQICIEFGLGKDSDYVFPHHEGGTLIHWHVGHQLRRLLIKWDLRKLPTGENITLYSWRASSITNRLATGWTVERVATAFNTSIQTISNSYYSEIMQQNLHRWANHYEEEIHWRGPDIAETNEIKKKIEKALKKKGK